MIQVVVGGFYGDEGKGKIVGYLAREDDADVVVRAGGGPNAGHTVIPGKKVRLIPSGWTNPRSRLLIARGTIINPEVLLNEIKEYGAENRLGIDFGCTVIEQRHIEAEQELVKQIGSVGTGTGPARADRILRKPNLKLAKDVPELNPFLTDVAREVNAVASGRKILIEGVQGYALSLLDHRFYPYVTSQDTTVCQFAADVGIGPKLIDEIIVVFKAYVSRVAAGPMKDEWTEEKMKQLGIEERGTVSGRKRRLGDFDSALAWEAIMRNTVTQVAITNLDRLFPQAKGITQWEQLPAEARKFLVQNLSPIFDAWRHREFRGLTLISTGPNLEDTIRLYYFKG
jgi:adenylosuccinate synthase